MKRRRKNDSRDLYREKHKVRKLMIASGCFLCAAAFAAGGLIVFGISGKYNLRKHTVSYAAGKNQSVQMVSARPDGPEETRKWQDGWVRYGGEIYSYNEDILTFLFMGIDKESGPGASQGCMDGGQADALFLLVLNPHEEEMKLIPINRSTMTAVDVYDERGAHQNTVTAQICIQHGYGDGGKESCAYQVKAVQNLFYGIPIHGYLSVDMDVIPVVIDLIGGLDLEALEDVRNGRREVILRRGEQAHLDGERAYWYVRDRDNAVELSADGRLERQRQFVTELIGKVKGMTRKDLTIPVKIYNEISNRAVTDITADEVVYLAAVAGNYQFDVGDVAAVAGRSVSGEENADSSYDEFYVDEDALYEMVLDIFYEPVD